MTPKEALKEITSKPKWYAVNKGDRKGESTYRVAALRILNDTAGVNLMKSFFAKFGYEVEINMEVKKSGR